MAKIIVKDFGWNRITHELKLMDNSFTKVGFPENSQVGKPRKKVKGEKIATEMSEVAAIAAFNEWGTKNIPSRPFMSTSFDENLQGLNRLKAKLYIEIVNGRMGVSQALSIIGEFMVSKTKKKIRDISSPPNAPSTIKKKKSANPLIDTGQMINSVTHVEVIK